MTDTRTHQDQSTLTPPTPVLRWIFHRDDAAMTCEVAAAGRGAYDVCLVPHWNIAATSIERFHSALSAVERHAEIVRRLRESGWVVVDHATPPAPTRAPLAA